MQRRSLKVLLHVAACLQWRSCQEESRKWRTTLPLLGIFHCSLATACCFTMFSYYFTINEAKKQSLHGLVLPSLQDKLHMLCNRVFHFFCCPWQLGFWWCFQVNFFVPMQRFSSSTMPASFGVCSVWNIRKFAPNPVADPTFVTERSPAHCTTYPWAVLRSMWAESPSQYVPCQGDRIGGAIVGFKTMVRCLAVEKSMAEVDFGFEMQALHTIGSWLFGILDVFKVSWELSLKCHNYYGN